MGKFNFIKTPIKDVYVIEPTVFGDNRGYFMETYQYEEFCAGGVDAVFVQDNQSKSKRGVLRGLHFQTENSQGKLVRVVSGEVFDVAVDLRRNSETFGKWYGVLLSAENKKQFVYKCTRYYDPTHEAGLMWNDPDIGIEWPIPDDMEILLSEKDKVHQSFKEFKEKNTF